jgi:hypothetical protein
LENLSITLPERAVKSHPKYLLENLSIILPERAKKAKWGKVGVWEWKVGVRTTIKWERYIEKSVPGLSLFGF